MAELNSPTPETSASATTVCPNCGGKISYDIKSRKFLCESCKSEQSITAPKSTVDEYSISDYRVREHSAISLTGVSVATCSSCGGEIYFDEHETAKQCPMCGSAQIRVAAATSGIAPEGVVPFRIDNDDAQQKFRVWISKRWFAPNLLKKAYGEGKLEGLYVPFWTYDADSCAEYVGQGGRTRTVLDREGNTHTETDWFPVSGRVYRKFDDVLICASKKQSGTIAAQVGPFNTVTDIAPFTYQYLSGYKAERYSIDGLECFGAAREQMEAELQEDADADILAQGFSQSRVTAFQPKYKDVTYKSVLLPIYTAQYGYRGETYFYAINGQTGHVAGNYPKSVPKIIAAVLAGLVLLFGLMYFMGFMESDDYDSDYSGYSDYGSSYDEYDSGYYDDDSGYFFDTAGANNPAKMRGTAELQSVRRSEIEAE
ncbi:MAG: hypothetical protein RSG53_00635 [Oscillospiraceae bacterium]